MVDFEGAAVHAEGRAEAGEEEGAHMLTDDGILPYVLSFHLPAVPRTTYSVAGWECLRCGHKWVPRITREPKRCPGCKSPYWNLARKRRNAR